MILTLRAEQVEKAAPDLPIVARRKEVERKKGGGTDMDEAALGGELLFGGGKVSRSQEGFFSCPA